MARTMPEAEGQRRSRYSDVEFSSVYAIPLDAITQSDWVLNGGYQSGVSHTLPGSQQQVCWTDSELCFCAECLCSGSVLVPGIVC